MHAFLCIMGDLTMVEKLSNQQYVSTTRMTQTNTMQNQETNLLNKNEKHDYDIPKDGTPLLDKEKMEELVNGLNEFLSPVQTSLKFELHEKLKEYYVTIVDDNTHEVVKEIPPKKMLDLYAAMVERIGIIVDKKI